MSNKLVNLKDGNDILVPKVLGGIDTNNVITFVSSTYSGYTPYTYTATQDCYVIAWTNNGWGGNAYNDTGEFMINGEMVFSSINTLCIYLKSGQTVSMIDGYANAKFAVKVFGLKY